MMKDNEAFAVLESGQEILLRLFRDFLLHVVKHKDVPPFRRVRFQGIVSVWVFHRLVAYFRILFEQFEKLLFIEPVAASENQHASLRGRRGWRIGGEGDRRNNE